jgi:hypothetical protein
MKPIRINDKLHKKLKEISKKEKRNLTQQLEILLEIGIKEFEGK